MILQLQASGAAVVVAATAQGLVYTPQKIQVGGAYLLIDATTLGPTQIGGLYLLVDRTPPNTIKVGGIYLLVDADRPGLHDARQEAVRAQYLGGDVNLAWRVRVYQEAFSFAVVRAYVKTADGVLADAFHDWGGQRLQWGDVAVDPDGRVLRLWNAATWGATPYWFAALDAADLDLGQCLTMNLEAEYPVPSIQQRTRPGLWAVAAGVWAVSYVTPGNVLQLTILRLAENGDLVWGPTSTGLILPYTYDALSVCPVAEGEIFILGLKGTVFAAQLHSSTALYAGTWTSGAWTPLSQNADLTWLDSLNGDAERLREVDALVVPVGSDGQNMIVTHRAGLYSTPHFILASPQADMGRRVWVNHLSVLAGRFWTTAWNVLEGDPGRYYAPHLVLLSSSDGTAWRDEGYISQRDVRGKLCLIGAELWLVSATAVLTMPALVSRFGDLTPLPGVPLVATAWDLTAVRTLSMTHGGQRQTAELRLAGQPGATLAVAPGMRIEYDLGALVGYTADGAPYYGYRRQFTGYIDQPTAERALGGDSEEWLCRGVLGNMLGETAYRPPTALWFPGRRVFTTTFLEEGEPVNALAALSGYWLAQKVTPLTPAVPYGVLTCRQSGLAVLPPAWTEPDLVVTVDGSTPYGLAVQFWDAAEDGALGTNYCVISYRGSSLYFTQTQADLVEESEVALGFATANVRIQFTISLGPGLVRADLVAGAAHGSYDFSTLWRSATPVRAAPPVSWRVGLEVDLHDVIFAGGGLNDLTLYVPDVGTPTRSYRLEITSLGTAETGDQFRWGYWENGAWAWQVSNIVITGWEQLLASDIVAQFAAVSGHTVGATWTFTYPQVQAYIYGVTACGGGDPLTVGELLRKCAEIARVPLQLPRAQTYPAESGLRQTALEGNLLFSATWATLELGDTAHMLIVTTTYAEFAGQRRYYPALDLPVNLRLVGNNDVLSLHKAGHVLAAWAYVIPANGVRITLGVGVEYMVPALPWPIDESWWDFNQPASSVLERILDRRRVYLYDDPDGIVRVGLSPERDVLLATEYPIGTHTAYARAVGRVTRSQDARSVLSLVQVIGDGSPGSRVAMLDPTMLQHGMRSTMLDNPWLSNETDALHEAQLVLDDNRRALEVRTVEGFWDPGIQIGGIGELQVDGVTWRGSIKSYNHEISMDDQAKPQLSAQWVLQSQLPVSAYAHWEATTQPPTVPQDTPVTIEHTPSKYNQVRWR